MGNKFDPALVLLATISAYQFLLGVKPTFVFVNVSSVNTSNLDVIPGAASWYSGLILEPYMRYNDGTSAISAIAKLQPVSNGAVRVMDIMYYYLLHTDAHASATRESPEPSFHFR